jgi:hypothetical protein
MTSPLTIARQGIVDELEAVFPGRKVYEWVPPSPVLPCVIVAPDDTTPLEQSGYGRWDYHLKVSAISNAQTVTPGSVAALEDDLEALAAWAGPLAVDLNIGPARFGDATVYAVGLTLLIPVTIPPLS